MLCNVCMLFAYHYSSSAIEECHVTGSHREGLRRGALGGGVMT